MKVLKKDMRSGYMKIKVEREEDVWHLKYLLEPGDVIRKKTFRTVLAGKEKKPCVLKLKVEKVNYTGKRIRTTGEIMEAPEDVERGYHTFNISEQDIIEVWKPENWKRYQLERIRKASNTRRYKFAVCLVDRGSASFHIITDSGIKDTGEVEESIPGKMFKAEGSEKEFYGKVISILSKIEGDKIILAGPGFEKENLYKEIKERHKELVPRIFVQDTSVIGRTGLNEVIKRGAIEKILKETRVSEEVLLVENVLERIAKKGAVAYGRSEVEKALEYGAVEKLLVVESELKQNEDIIEKADRQGSVTVVHEDHEAGIKLKNVGGLAALLRFRI